MNPFVIPAALDCLRKGSALTSSGLWRTGGIALSAAIGGFALSINSIAGAFGHDLHIDQPTADAIGAVAAWVVGTITHLAASHDIGVLPAKPGVAEVVGAAGGPSPGVGTALGTPVGGGPAIPATPAPVRPGGLPDNPAA